MIISEVVLDESILPEVGIGFESIDLCEGMGGGEESEHAEVGEASFRVDGDVFVDGGFVVGFIRCHRVAVVIIIIIVIAVIIVIVVVVLVIVIHNAQTGQIFLLRPLHVDFVIPRSGNGARNARRGESGGLAGLAAGVFVAAGFLGEGYVRVGFLSLLLG